MKKKTIKIAHLYYDLMNIYGETGNILALERFCKRQNVNTFVDHLSLNDDIDFDKYDFYYIGAGNEDNSYLVLCDLYKYKEDIKKSIEKGKMFLVTGNAFELFGKKKRLSNGRFIECLKIFDYVAVEAKERLVNEVSYTFDKLDEGKKILGFKNAKFNITNNDEHRLFGFKDSFNYKNFFGMSFIGPILIRNPHFTNYLLKTLFEQLGYDYTPIKDTIEFKAYDEYLKNFLLED